MDLTPLLIITAVLTTATILLVMILVWLTMNLTKIQMIEL